MEKELWSMPLESHGNRNQNLGATCGKYVWWLKMKINLENFKKIKAGHRSRWFPTHCNCFCITVLPVRTCIIHLPSRAFILAVKWRDISSPASFCQACESFSADTTVSVVLNNVWRANLFEKTSRGDLYWPVSALFFSLSWLLCFEGL